ncbi:hypothetical protein [Veronia pacifica]|uniref:Uncharacterized protein n=1 Tax=Veronia pacifica TaxID=1080227 RepID=A0A1C3EQZ7_9GAMM|nr:hypothetical protein [Veronia pacifica]ODA35675.1 hypothetical protein A8L45_03410 [Veronia pacifica]
MYGNGNSNNGVTANSMFSTDMGNMLSKIYGASGNQYQSANRIDLSTFDQQRQEASANLMKIMRMKDAQNSFLAEHAIGNSQLSTRLSLDMKLAQKIGRLVSDS